MAILIKKLYVTRRECLEQRVLKTIWKISKTLALFFPWILNSWLYSRKILMLRLFEKLCYFHFTTHFNLSLELYNICQSIVIDIYKVLKYLTSLMVLFLSSTISSTSSPTSQWTQFVSVKKINHGRVLSYTYVGRHVSILLFLSDYSRDRDIRTNFGKFSKHEIQRQWIRQISRFFVRANRRTDMTRLTVTFHSFLLKAPKKEILLS